jgi:isocitrate dehydrogenase
METITVRTLNGVPIPTGETIQFKDGKPVTPKHPIIPFIEGDGIGAEIWGATRKILDMAISVAYGDKRSIAWLEVFAGGTATTKFGEALPADTLAAIQEFGVAIKGPLNTPTGGGMRSLNVALRKHFDLFRCVRPVRWYKGVPSPVVRPQDLDIVIFRENTEDVYSGIDFEVGSPEALRIIALLAELGHTVRDDSGIGVKPISKHCSRRLVRSAIQYAIEHNRKTVTLVHKGNIQKYTEGAFRQWGYELAKEEFGDIIVTEDELWSQHQGNLPEGKILLNDRIADNMFADALLRPTRYSVIATPNLNGDYLSDATAAQVGGLGIAPGANLGETHAIFEATHGTAPDIAGRNLANPCSLLLSAVMMLEYIGWHEAASMVVKAIEKTIAAKTVTGDLARLMSDAKALSTTEFAEAVVANLPIADEQIADKEIASANNVRTKATNRLPGARYLVRELIPRAILLTAVFKYWLPLVPHDLFQFHGSLATAAAFGVAFTAMFCLLGSYLMGSAPMRQFMQANQKAWWFIPANIAFVLGAPAVGLLLAALAVPTVFSMSGVLAALVGSVGLNIACAITHDYRALRG